jgi:hypothetical protein
MMSMTRRLLTALVFALLPTVVHAQGATTPVTVTVHSGLTLITEGITSFGMVDNNVTRVLTINPVGPAYDQTTTSFIASGVPSADLVVTFDATTDLCHQVLGCAQKIVFTPHVMAWAPCESCAPIDFSSGGTVRLDALGKSLLTLGGSIQIVANQPAGVYTGLFNMSAVYQ